jgi:DNA-binding SARP family transcriptional activator
MLALNAERVVDLSELVDELWPECPPASAVENVCTYAGNLRRLFNSAEGARNRIRRQGLGYQLSAQPDELDLLAMAEETRRGRRAAARGDFASAVDLFAAARARWRGPLLAGLRRGPRLAARCTAIEHEWTVLVEEEAELHLRRGESAAAIVLLHEHLAANPLRERTYALLMQALYRTGDVAGALGVYMTARKVLATELGIDPGPELRRIHRGVLNHDPALAGPVTSRGPAQPSQPRELPPDIGSFVGRHDETQQLLDTLAPARLPVRHRPIVINLYGRGGVGKSALAVHAAHQVVDRFPDGQLYLDLYGATPGQRPLSTADALVHMLHGLGVVPADTPSDERGIIARFRTCTADRRLLVLLDNASDADQVLPLLPASGGCGVIITSRQPLTAVDADERVRLGVLPHTEGCALLRALNGEAGSDRAATGEIVKFCEGLPLAIRIAAGRLIGRPDLAAAELAGRLADDRQRLDELNLDGMGVRSCIRVGYQGLLSNPTNDLAARVFRALGLLRVPDVQPELVAAMLDEPEVPRVRAALDQLVAIQLLETVPGRRFRFHDLVRLVAAEEAEREGPGAQDETLLRALTYYLNRVASADNLLRPGRLEQLTDPLVKASTGGVRFDGVDVQGWLAVELPNLVALAEQASRATPAARRYVLWISFCLAAMLYHRFHAKTARRLGELVLDMAKRHGDAEMSGWGRWLLGRALAELGDNKSAVAQFEQGLSIFATTTSPYGSALMLNALGIVGQRSNQIAEAADYFTGCLDLARQAGLVYLEAAVLFNLGNLCLQNHEWVTARDHLLASLVTRRRLGDRDGMTCSLSILALLACHEGNLAQSRSYLDEAARYATEVGDRQRECNCLLIDTELHLRLGEPARALELAETLVAHARRYGYRYAEAAALRQQAKALSAIGDRSVAAERLAQAHEALAAPGVIPDRAIEVLLTWRPATP